VLPLVGLAHGSRDPRASSATQELLTAVAALRPGLIAVPAYLDLAEPTLTETLSHLKVPEVIVVPLLFTDAYHAGIDTPDAIRLASGLSGTRVRRAGILGMGAEVLTSLAVRAVEAGIGDQDAIVLAAVGSSSATANTAVAELAQRWQDERSAPVRAAFATAGEPKVAAALAALAQTGRRVGVSPLFAAPGLLLSAIARDAAQFDAPVAAPLGTALAPLVLARYDDVARSK
jgi:sirohydrochlorin ferrochelatase